jgi:hypothetical protein
MTSESQAARRPLPAGIDRLVPRAGVRTQLTAAALVWLVGASILIFRGFGYVLDRHWHAWILGVALAIAVIKSRYLLDRIATKAVARIKKRGTACFFGFFSVKSWAFVALMMGGGIAIRNAIVAPGVIGAGILGALYLGIGTALFIADRVFWHAVYHDFRKAPDAV